MDPRAGAFAGVSGARKRMPVTCRSVVLMPSVANGVRMQAAKASTRPPSGIGGLAGQLANLREELRGDLKPGRIALRGLVAPRAGQAHAPVLQHGGEERLHPLQVDVATGEGARIDGEEALPDPRGTS